MASQGARPGMSGGAPFAGSLEEQASGRHLLELGYADPLETAARESMRKRAQESELNRAGELLSAGDVGSAIELLERAVAGDDAWTAGRHWLARAYFRAGRLNETQKLLHWHEVHGVEHAELALMRARIALKRRKLDEALDSASYAKCLQDPLPEADLLIGEIHFRRNQLDAAEAAYTAAETRAPSAASAAGLAAIALRRRNAELAADQCLTALDRDMNHWPAHYRLGLALLQMEHWPEARLAFETVTRLQPELAGPHRFLSRLSKQENPN
jgi:tetratricopeptide (TPR) repeat protein